MEQDAEARARGMAPTAATQRCCAPPARVLVVEDDIVSQQIAQHYLEAIGCEVVIVGHGLAAVDACKRTEFALVLMDLCMPVMDGLQAAREIRRRENPGKHLPILAIAARAAADELARCTAAGMDGLLTKPLELARLRRALDRFGLARRAAELSPSPAQADSPMDLMSLRAKHADDLAVVRSLCETFMSTIARVIEDLERALAAGERTLVRQLAHRIKGAGSGVHAHRLAAIAANIESEALSKSVPDLSQEVEHLRRAFDEVSLHVGAELR